MHWTDESMASLHQHSRRRLEAMEGMAVIAAAVLLAGCSATTYGTGTDPGVQTLKDVAGIAMLSEKKPPIDYEPRPKVVPPPQGAAAQLPPPEAQAAAIDDSPPPDWPVDPDVKRAKFKADIAAREARGEPAPALKLPPGTFSPRQPTIAAGGPQQSKPLTAEEQVKIRKAFADAKGTLAVDANGNPVRRYLTEPPADYRQPDPTEPVVFTEKKKKFHWFWQKQDSADNLTPDATAPADSTQTATAMPPAH